MGAPPTLAIVLVLDIERGLGIQFRNNPRARIDGNPSALGEAFSRTTTRTTITGPGTYLLAPGPSERAEDPKPAASLVDSDITGIDVVIRDVLVSALNHEAPIPADEVPSAYVRLQDKLKRSTDDFLTLLNVEIVSTEA
jgi:hypothetical protein